MVKIEYISVNFEDNGIKLEKFILNRFNVYNYIYLQKLIRTGQVRVNKKRVKPGYALKTGDILRLPIINDSCSFNKKLSKDKKTTSFKSFSFQEKALIKFLLNNILYQDDHILAINKPKGLSVQGGRGLNTSLDRLLPYFKESLNIIYNCSLKLVHRLDKETSGILLLAKTNAGAKYLFSQFKEQKIKKVYYCLVQGKVDKNGVINANLLKVNSYNNRSIIDKTGKSAITEYKVLGISSEKYLELNNISNYFHITLLKVFPKTGRNHQISAHLSLALNTPILGDFKYGFKLLDLPFKLSKNEIFLHAYSITFYNLENKKIDVVAPLDIRWIDSLKKVSLYENIKELRVFYE